MDVVSRSLSFRAFVHDHSQSGFHNMLCYHFTDWFGSLLFVLASMEALAVLYAQLL